MGEEDNQGAVGLTVKTETPKVVTGIPITGEGVVPFDKQAVSLDPEQQRLDRVRLAQEARQVDQNSAAPRNDAIADPKRSRFAIFGRQPAGGGNEPTRK